MQKEREKQTRKGPVCKVATGKVDGKAIEDRGTVFHQSVVHRKSTEVHNVMFYDYYVLVSGACDHFHDREWEKQSEEYVVCNGNVALQCLNVTFY